MKDHTRKLRDLRHLAAVFDNGFAPPGWVEIQRLDAPDTGPEDLRPLDSDDEAAMLVAERAGMPGCAMAYHRASGSIFLLTRAAPDGSVETVISNDEFRRLAVHYSDLPAWIAIVPAQAAYEAGLATRKRESAALRGWT